MSARDLDAFHAPLDRLQVVEASAGSGKTWNLCVMVLRLLLEQELPLPRILVLSFTNAAVAELRDRVRARLRETAAALAAGAAARDEPFTTPLLAALRRRGLDDEAIRLRLDEALQQFDDAAIHTIHGFCARALADHAFGSGEPLEPVDLVDDREWMERTAHDFWRRHVIGVDGRSPLAASLDAHGDTPEGWADVLADVVERPFARREWPAHADRVPEHDDAALQAAWQRATWLWNDDRERIAAIVRSAQPNLNGKVYKDATIDAALVQWDRWLAGGDPTSPPPETDKSKDKRLLLAASQLKPNKGKPRPEAHAFFEAADAVMSGLQSRRESGDAERAALLRRFVAEAPGELDRAKREARVRSNHDLLQRLHDRLHDPRHPGLAATLRRRYPAALVDEFQDTDPLQWRILRAIYPGADAPLVLIGDPKQAIYAFRGADLHTYLQARASSPVRLTLRDNQRSSPALLRGFNALFGRQPRALLQRGLDHAPVRRGARPFEPLVEDGEPDDAPALRLWHLPGPATGGSDDDVPSGPDALVAAAEATADEIVRLLNDAQAGRIRIGGHELRAGQIAVLVRRQVEGTRMRQALARRGVAAVELSRASVWASDEAEDVEHRLAAVLQPTRTDLVLAAQASATLGRDAEALLALHDDEAAWSALREQLADDLQTWTRRGVAAMLRRTIARDGVAARVLALPDGARRMTNLLHLADLLQAAAADLAGGGPAALLRWMQQRRQRALVSDRDAEDHEQLRLDTDRHLVQIVTVHRSKGLEYPVVFCPFLWRTTPPRSDRHRPLRWHDDDGATVLDFRPADGDHADEVRRRIAREAAAEDLRLAYVALTRASHRCTVVVGRYRHARSDKPAGRNALAWLAGGTPEEADEWPQTPLDKARLDADWRTLVATHPEAFALQPLPAPRAAGKAALVAGDGAPPALAVPPPPPVPPPWWIASFSALVGGAVPAVPLAIAAADRDRHLPPDDEPVAAPAPAPAEADDILGFERGAAAGECIHRVLELADFGDPAAWPAAVDDALSRHRPARTPRPRAAAMLRSMLAQVLATPLPLPGGDRVALADVAAARRRAEMSFTLPAGELRAQDLRDALARCGWPAPPLADTALRGYLTGFIDLVFEHQGRHHLLDWKSNHLGGQAGDYAAQPVEHAVFAHGYQLQSLLYLLALHRWLRHRLRDYDPARHLGGAMVLFVRGVRPDWPGAGVWCARPSVAVLDALSQRLDDPSKAAR